MAKRKIAWLQKADIKLFDILNFYKVRNGNAVYSTKLYKKFIKELKLLDKHPELSITTDFETVKRLIVDNYILFYEIFPKTIYNHTVWDCRQNPDDLKIL